MRSIATIALSLAAGLAAAGFPAAPAADPALRNDPYWTLNTALIVELHLYDDAAASESDASPISSGAPVTRKIGEVYDSPDFQRMLLRFIGHSASYVLDLAGGEACEYQAADFRASADADTGHPARPPEDSGSVIGNFFTQADGTISFSMPAADLLVRAAPELVGELARDEIEARLPGFGHKVAVYAPDDGQVATLRAVETPSDIVAFFGTWCSTCRDELPALAKTLDAAANPRLALRMVGVDEDLAEPYELLSDLAVSDVPLVLVLQGGIEVGRIIDEPQVSIEHHLAQILRAEAGR